MSNLRDIMDVDVEPLESQAYRKAQEAAEQEASLRGPITSTSNPSSPSIEGKGKATIRRRRSSRVSKSSAPTSSSASAPASTSARSGSGRRRSSATSDAMDYSLQTAPGGAYTYQSSSPGYSPQQSGGQEPAGDVPVKYTPVTGRISRAKKGVPVHTCEICRPVKTFTRAEHLRRHQLSHQKPTYPCTFEDCERAFHRPDLLARHRNRHETQGEKPYKAGDRKSRASSSASERFEPGSKAESGHEASYLLMSSSAQMDTRPSAAGENPSVGSDYNPGTGTGSFPPVNYAPSSTQGTAPSSSGLGGGRNLNGTTYVEPSSALPVPLGFSPFTGPDDIFASYTSSHSLPLLRIPEETLMPGLSHTQDNSPWCSSASDSTFSTQSDQRVPRGRSASVATVPEWPSALHAQSWMPQMSVSAAHDLRSSPFDPLAEGFETSYASPRVASPTFSRQLLDLPNMYGENYMESVGTRPNPSIIEMSIAQLNSASPSRISVARLARLGNRAKGLVEQPQLASFETHQNAPSVSFDLDVADYWTYFDPLFPIIHRGTFKHRFDSDPGAGTLLEAAMAAIGTQYSDSPDTRRKGTEIHAFCRRNIDLCPWNLQTMQAILLTELFKTFRARKTSIKPSRQFEELCKRLLQLLALHDAPGEVQVSDSNDRWNRWAEQESRRRLLSGCFIFDCHQALFHEQPRLASLQTESISSFLTVPCPENWWNAQTPSIWQALLPASSTPEQDLAHEIIDPHSTSAKSAFTQLLLIGSLASHMPASHRANLGDLSGLETSVAVERITRVFPSDPLANTYLALHHTPLCDLLAVTGETWVFSRKLTPPSAFITAKARLKAWSSSKAAASATKYACHALRSFLLENCGTCPRNTRRQISYSYGLSYYWGLYTSVLICWAFGYRHQNTTAASLPTGQFHSPRKDSETKARALLYVESMLRLSEAELLTPKAALKADTTALISVVMARLEEDSIGNQTMAIVDAINVLKQLGELGHGKWF
ncbi:hypothetical protein PVAG01_03638 [Phlyctema vagabunda]|uniref:C2H2-type domain-containing protein n=1 Tax=Phlyctema vagabunda TaxID=108571 RepID=A0ABR4PMP7_9HELO